MKIAVIGAGAMGSVYAALLKEGGHEVHLVDVWKEHIEAIEQNGLWIEGASGNRVVPSIGAHHSAETVGVCELVIIATKASAVAAAAATTATLIDENSLILTIQNGLGAGERILEAVGKDSVAKRNIILGVAGGFGASIQSPGHVHHNGMQLIRIGEMLGGASERVEKLAAVWREAGFNVRAFEDINQLIWEKFICNVTFSAPCTVFEKTLGGLISDPHAWPIALGCAREAFNAAIAHKIYLDFNDPDQYVFEFGQNMPNARPSMYLDHLEGRRSEIDAINGMVPTVSKQVGLEAPLNEALTAILRSREERFS